MRRRVSSEVALFVDDFCGDGFRRVLSTLPGIPRMHPVRLHLGENSRKIIPIKVLSYR
jgi:hypothetical protein